MQKLLWNYKIGIVILLTETNIYTYDFTIYILQKEEAVQSYYLYDFLKRVRRNSIKVYNIQH